MTQYNVSHHGQTLDINVHGTTIKHRNTLWTVEEDNGKLFITKEDGTTYQIRDVVEQKEGGYLVHINGYTLRYQVNKRIHVAQDQQTDADGLIKSPIAGIISSILVKVGDQVIHGDILAVISAMKMENKIISPLKGRITSIEKNLNELAETGDILIIIEEE